MTNLSNVVRIENAILARAKAGRFHAKSYDPTTGAAAEIDTATAALKVPESAIVGELGSKFGQDRNMGRRVQHRRNQWKFELHLGFSIPVTLEFFEQDLLDNPVKVSREPGLDPVILLLEDTFVQAPPQQQPASGTKARLTFTTAMLGRH